VGNVADGSPAHVKLAGDFVHAPPARYQQALDLVNYFLPKHLESSFLMFSPAIRPAVLASYSRPISGHHLRSQRRTAARLVALLPSLVV
jgi:hypothetical protein